MSIKHRDGAGIITRNMKQSPLFGGLQLSPDLEDEIESIEDVPEAGKATDRQEDRVPIEVAPKKQYGPKAPRYGPSIASVGFGASAPAGRRSSASDPGLYVSLESARSSRDDAELPRHDVGTHR